MLITRFEQNVWRKIPNNWMFCEVSCELGIRRIVYIFQQNFDSSFVGTIRDRVFFPKGNRAGDQTLEVGGGGENFYWGTIRFCQIFLHYPPKYFLPAKGKRLLEKKAQQAWLQMSPERYVQAPSSRLFGAPRMNFFQEFFSIFSQV